MSFTSTLIWYGLLVLLAYYVYRWFTKVPRLHKHFKQYKNISVTNPHFLLGDYTDEYEKEYQIKFHIESAKANKDLDLVVRFDFRTPSVYLASHNAVKDFKALFPEKIDRDNLEGLTFGKLYHNSFENSRTDERWKNRSQFFFGSGPLKRPQSLISTMLAVAEEYMEKWKKGKNYDLVEEFGNIMQDTILTVLFGEQFWDKIGKCRIKTQTGYKTMEFGDALDHTQFSSMHNAEGFAYGFFPYLIRKSPIEPFKTDQENIDEIKRVLKDFLSDGGKKDIKEFLFFGKKRDVAPVKDLTDDEFLSDVLDVIDAGSGTLYLAIPSCLYRLKQNPRVYKKLSAEIYNSPVINEFYKDNPFASENACAELSSIDYLSYVVKESLRLDPPTNGSVPYRTLSDVQICNVPVPKNCLVYTDVGAHQFNPQNWHKADKFLPERFDPESEFFSKPGQEVPRDSSSFMAFSIGQRKCPGDQYALLAMKVMVAYTMMRVEYIVEESILKDPDYRIGLEADDKLPVKISKKYDY